MPVFRHAYPEDFITDNFRPIAQMAHGLAPQLAPGKIDFAAQSRVGDICHLRFGLAGVVEDIPHHLDSSASPCLSFFFPIETTQR